MLLYKLEVPSHNEQIKSEFFIYSALFLWEKEALRI